MQEYIDRINKLPEPYRSAARQNYKDARKDLKTWPGLRDQILGDLDEAISHYEAEAKQQA